MAKRKNLNVYSEATKTAFTIPRTPALEVAYELYHRLRRMEMDADPLNFFDDLWASAGDIKTVGQTSISNKSIEFEIAEQYRTRLVNIHQQLLDLSKDMMGDPSPAEHIATDTNLTRLASLLKEVEDEDEDSSLA